VPKPLSSFWLVLTCFLFLTQSPDLSAAQEEGTRSGVFDGHGDVGTVLHAGSVDYDASKQTYTITGSGENMWSVADAFQFVWKKMSGE